MQSAPLGSNNIVFITLYFQTKWFRGITELFFLFLCPRADSPKAISSG